MDGNFSVGKKKGMLIYSKIKCSKVTGQNEFKESVKGFIIVGKLTLHSQGKLL